MESDLFSLVIEDKELLLVVLRTMNFVQGIK